MAFLWFCCRGRSPPGRIGKAIGIVVIIERGSSSQPPVRSLGRAFLREMSASVSMARGCGAVCRPERHSMQRCFLALARWTESPAESRLVICNRTGVSASGFDRAEMNIEQLGVETKRWDRTIGPKKGRSRRPSDGPDSAEGVEPASGASSGLVADEDMIRHVSFEDLGGWRTWPTLLCRR